MKLSEFTELVTAARDKQRQMANALSHDQNPQVVAAYQDCHGKATAFDAVLGAIKAPRRTAAIELRLLAGL